MTPKESLQELVTDYKELAEGLDDDVKEYENIIEYSDTNTGIVDFLTQIFSINMLILHRTATACSIDKETLLKAFTEVFNNDK